ncbi:hypothetical protein H072_423 [Dactylellina haptotyla CBS 200.50]|uniref:Uncharacterized protein n=1 Tax=Dactylellina haptotyla (strain CBS 200.50) TaxID=1284197 RepID=S8CD46_DACHA|nr:hypothetical protein H072_423 [Dactylellina haptotyla CBS 200.50]
MDDPALQPFLSDAFSPTAYLNSTLPPLSPPAASLQLLHSTATDLLSSLDAHLNRLQTTLSTLTDEILRATPRLSYELQVLRSDVISLADTLSSARTRQLTDCLADVSLDPAGDQEPNDDRNDNEPKARRKSHPATSTTPTTPGKPQVLKRLETLALVRRHLQEVRKVFDDAMEWTLTDAQKTGIPLPTTATSSLGAYIPPSRSPSPSVMDGRKRASHSGNNAAAGSDKFTDEISYLLLNEEVDKATQKVEELAKLCDVWKNTSEYDARLRFVENLRWKVMEATKVEEPQAAEKKDPTADRGVYTINLPEVSLPKDGYLGFINQFKQMRDSIGQAGI